MNTEATNAIKKLCEVKLCIPHTCVVNIKNKCDKFSYATLNTIMEWRVHRMNLECEICEIGERKRERFVIAIIFNEIKAAYNKRHIKFMMMMMTMTSAVHIVEQHANECAL